MQKQSRAIKSLKSHNPSGVFYTPFGRRGETVTREAIIKRINDILGPDDVVRTVITDKKKEEILNEALEVFTIINNEDEPNVETIQRIVTALVQHKIGNGLDLWLLDKLKPAFNNGDLSESLAEIVTQAIAGETYDAALGEIDDVELEALLQLEPGDLDNRHSGGRRYKSKRHKRTSKKHKRTYKKYKRTSKRHK
jgi:hypothetical protein